MGYIVANLMTYTTPQDAFAITVALFSDFGLRANFEPGFPGLEECYYIFFKLIQKYLPKVYDHLDKEDVLPMMFCSQWFMTAFANDFSLDIVVRIWDVYFVEGRKTLFRIGLTILQLNQDEILRKPFE